MAKLTKKIKDLRKEHLPLVNRPRCYTYHGPCIYCDHTVFRYYGQSFGKKYYQCELCHGINH
jgi:hypothetical protein